MKTCKEWLETLMRSRALTAYGAAKLIGITPDAAYHYIAGDRAFDAYTASRIAELLGVDPVLVIASAEAERSKDAQRRAYWERLGGTAAAVALVFIMAGPMGDPSPAFAELGSVACVLCQITAGQQIATVHALIALLFMFILAIQGAFRKPSAPQ